MDNKLYFAKLMVYELYKLDWMSRISTERQMDNIKNYFEETLPDEYIGYSYKDWLDDYGYDGELYVCFDEFCYHELQVKEYIRGLIGDCKPLLECIEEYWKTQNI